MAGSPLKRSFTAVTENVKGFTYLKRRRLSEEKALSDEPISQSQSQGQSVFRRMETGEHEANGSERMLSPPSSVDQSLPAAPAIQESEPSPTEPNTPSESGGQTQVSSVGRESFSSLINYDPSSQMSKCLYASTSRAELLKLRLKVAMYKVRTNQIDTPFSQLHMEEPQPKTTTQAVEEAVAQLRHEAQRLVAKSGSLSTEQTLHSVLHDIPILKPASHSSRMILDPTLPSSPPTEYGPQKSPDRQLKIGINTPQQAGNARLDDQDFTSSVKGRVAEGLLGLKKAI